MAKRKKKKSKNNKPPAKKRNKGTLLLTNDSMQKLKEEKEECKEIFLENIEYEDKGFENKINNFFKNKSEIYELNLKKEKVKAMYAKLFIPQDTKRYLPQNIENLKLKIEKFPYFELKDKNEFKAIYYDKYCIDFDSSFYYKNLEKLNLKKIDFELEIADKLIVGLGSVSVYETSITLHYIYGVPYIPASAIKGSFRSYIIHKYFENELKKYDNCSKFENEILFKTKWFVDIFGTEDIQGKVYFFDSFAITNPLQIEKDIMNSHYPDYYDKKQPPTDTQNPRPINFLTINKKFRFVFGVKKDFKITIGSKEKNILEFVEENLKKSLQEFGIGAKTSVGYGYFKIQNKEVKM